MATLAGWLAGKVGYDSLQAINVQVACFLACCWYITNVTTSAHLQDSQDSQGGKGAEHPVGQWKPQPTHRGEGGAEHPVGQWKPQPTGGGGLSIQWARALQTLTMAEEGEGGPVDLTHI